MKKTLFPTNLAFALFFFLTALTNVACQKEDQEEEETEPNTAVSDTTTAPTDTATVSTKTITVGVYLLSGSTYTDSDKDLVFTTSEDCQSWSRTAQGGDGHSNSSHDHFNAAKEVTYDETTSTITWTEFGPELTQSEIDATCSAGADGAIKTANKTDYIQDKNFYLQIKKVE
jgi:hypothetical protein